MNNWTYFFGWVDMFFDFFWSLKIWGLPVIPIMVGVFALGLILDVFLVSVRE